MQACVPDFLPETKAIRDSRLERSRPVPPTCRTGASRSPAPRSQDGDQRAELGAKLFMADFEDSHAPTGSN
jgi:hypothetical protein